MNIKKITIALGLLLSGAFIQANACEHLELGVPGQSDQINCLEGYAIGYNYKIKSADWVAYRLEKQVGEGVERQDDFRLDPSIPAKFRTLVEDYEEPIYHMGHLANSESIDVTIKANSETFLMSNMTPQLPSHNTAIWKGLENRERKWANKYGLVYVFAGPLYPEVPETIGASKVPVPNAYWKVVYIPSKSKAIAFFTPHQALYTKDIDKHTFTVDHIEKSCNVDLLSALPDAVENAIEKKLVKQRTL